MAVTANRANRVSASPAATWTIQVASASAGAGGARANPGHWQKGRTRRHVSELGAGGARGPGVCGRPVLCGRVRGIDREGRGLEGGAALGRGGWVRPGRGGG